MAEVAPARLRWQRHPLHGYIAYPHGPGVVHHYAMIWPDPGLPGGGRGWRWTVRIGYADFARNLTGGVYRHGAAESRQAAADAATEAWPEIERLASEPGGSGGTHCEFPARNDDR